MNNTNILMFSTVIIGSAAIYVAYYLMKKTKSLHVPKALENIPSMKNFKNKPRQEKDLDPKLNSETEIEPEMLNISTESNQIGLYYSTEPENRYLQPIEETTSWEIIGRVKSLYIYPIEGGSKLKVNRMHCSNIGSTELGFEAMLRDRSFVVYSVNQYTNAKVALLEDPKLSVIKIKQEGNTLLISSPDTEPIDILIDKIFEVPLTDVQYGDGTVINVQDCGDDISVFLTLLVRNRLEKNGTILRLGLYVSPPRGLKHHIKGISLIGEEKRDHYVKSLRPTYSACTIVNEASVELLRNEMGNPKLTHEIFRPHIVISGKIPSFAEDKIKALKIGLAVFTSKLPCLHNENLNLNPETGTTVWKKELYQTFLKTRGLANIHSEYNVQEPIFGINMKISYEGDVTEGDTVFAQWDKASTMK